MRIRATLPAAAVLAVGLLDVVPGDRLRTRGGRGRPHLDGRRVRDRTRHLRRAPEQRAAAAVARRRAGRRPRRQPEGHGRVRRPDERPDDVRAGVRGRRVRNTRRLPRVLRPVAARRLHVPHHRHVPRDEDRRVVHVGTEDVLVGEGSRRARRSPRCRRRRTRSSPTRIQEESDRTTTALTAATTEAEAAASSAQDAADSAKTIGIIGVVVGAIGLIVGIVAFMATRKRA